MRIILAAAVLGLAGCVTTQATQLTPNSATHAKAERDMRASLRDPESGSFRNFRSYQIANGETAVCADVNARNGFGGMTGFQPMAINYGQGREPIVWFDGLAAYECGNLAGGLSAR